MKKYILLLFYILFLLQGCKEVYDPLIISPQTGYLVVEGLINSGTEPTTIKLSRTTKLEESVFQKPEINASVVVEGDNNTTFTLVQSGAGIYSSSQPLQLNATASYRIKINTSDGGEYVSRYSSVRTTPVIDSITWKPENNGVQIYVHNHDDKTNEKSYYRWQYNETWEIRSNFLGSLKYEYNQRNEPIAIAYKFPDQSFDNSIFYCWQSFSSSNLLLGSTEKLSKNVIYLPIAFIPQASVKLGVLYSIELKQYALSKEAYDFYVQMKKNTEQLGSIFDPQPSDIRGNITSVNNPSEIVIGYVEVNSEQTKRMFISEREVPDWGYQRYCEVFIVPNTEIAIKENSGRLPVVPTEFNNDGSIKTFQATVPDCLDCRTRGTNIKPSFWPN